MGYETRAYVVAPWDEEDSGGEVLAMVDLCGLGSGSPLPDLIQERTQSGPWMSLPPLWPLWPDGWDALCSFARASGRDDLTDSHKNGRVTTDLYGDRLPAIPFDEFCVALDAELERSDYRRLLCASALLLSIRQTWKGRPLVVVTYGH